MEALNPLKLLSGPKMPPPPAPPPAAPLPPSIDEARRRRQAQDAAARRQGRQASILTGPEGVGSTPVATRTLIGS